MTKYSLSLFLMLAVLLQGCGDRIAIGEEPFKNILNPSSEYIAIFGDIQNYTSSNSDIKYYCTSVEWLLSNLRHGQHINCVLHTGDITWTNSPSSWKLFERETSALAKETLYLSAIGDHDYTWHDKIYISDRSDTHFNEYMCFPGTKSKLVAQFESNHFENVIVENQIWGERYDIISLEFGPREEVVAWANEYVSSHPDVKFILLNHEYLEAGGGIRTTNLKCVARIRNSSYTKPAQLWSRLIKDNDNIVCVICGHVGGLYALTLMENAFGREVPQIEHNIQGSAYRYDNWLMLWEFPQVGDSVSIVNTGSGVFYKDSRSLFTFRYRY